MDIQIVTGVAAVALYIAKYIGKNEPETLRDDIRHTLQTLRESRQPIRVQMEKVWISLLSFPKNFKRYYSSFIFSYRSLGFY